MDGQQQDLSGIGVVIILAIAIPIWIVMIWAAVRIVQKAGYSGWNVLWYFIPIVGIIMFLIFAFGEWPVTRRLRELEKQVFGPLSSGAIDRPA